MTTNQEAGLAGQIRAQRQLRKLIRYGSHRAKVTVRRAGSMSPKDAINAVRAELRKDRR